MNTATANYPAQALRVEPFPPDLSALYARPIGLLDDPWPSVQLAYLSLYLKHLDCKAIVIESHYIDKDYLLDFTLYYSRSLRNYPNFCSRLHFFSELIDETKWRSIISMANHGRHAEAEARLQGSYLGFSVARPLPGFPVGRTVLRTFSEHSGKGHRREFQATRPYGVHLAGFALSVSGLAFQQQDQGVSACATTALWSAIHCVATKEGLPLATPGEITEAASRYFLAGGRALPSEGLNVHQMCEAVRAVDLSPLVIAGASPAQDIAQLHGYISSGFAPVLALQPFKGGPNAAEALEGVTGHAVCAVGLKIGDVTPRSTEQFHFIDGASEAVGLYVHDDRLGPYSSVDIHPYTYKGKVRTSLLLKWPDEVQAEQSILEAIVVPLPPKLRLTMTHMRILGLPIADACGQLFPEFEGRVTLRCRYEVGTVYRQNAYDFGLSDDGVAELTQGILMSRYIGLVQISAPNAPLLDVLLDTTETRAQPAVLCCVKRSGLREDQEAEVAAIARRLGTRLIK